VDFKASALRYLDRADAVLLCAPEVGKPGWNGVSLKLIEHRRATLRVSSRPSLSKGWKEQALSSLID
jgi:hypothetical protein